MPGLTFAGTTVAGEAPDIQGGIYDARFDGVEVKAITGGKYGDGDRFEWSFTLFDDDGEVLYDEGEPVEVQGLTSMSTNVASQTVPKAVRYLKAIMTPAEFAAFQAGEGIDEDALLGRKVQVEVAIKENGWPTIVSVLPPRQARKSRGSKPATDEVDEG